MFHRVTTITGHERPATKRYFATWYSPAIGVYTAEPGVALWMPCWTSGISFKESTKKREDANWLRKCIIKLYALLVPRTSRRKITSIALTLARINMAVLLWSYSCLMFIHARTAGHQFNKEPNCWTEVKTRFLGIKSFKGYIITIINSDSGSE